MNEEEQQELDIPDTTVTETEEGLEKDVQRNLDKANKDYQEAKKLEN